MIYDTFKAGAVNRKKNILTNKELKNECMALKQGNKKKIKKLVKGSEKVGEIA